MSETGNRVDRQIGARIQRERERVGLSRAELAAQVRISGTELDAMEQGHTRPEGRVLLEIASTLGVPITELMKPPGE